MKKIFAATIITIMAICIFAGCSRNSVTNPEDNAVVSSTNTKTEKAFEMEADELVELYLKLYEEKSKDEYFISESEAEIYTKYDFSIRNLEYGCIFIYNSNDRKNGEYYHPIIIPDITEVVIAYVDEYGCLSTYNLTQNSYDYYRNIHVLESQDFIDSFENYSVVHSSDSIQVWSYGKMSAEVKLPSNSIYAGYSDWEGYIFRDNGDVYSVIVSEQYAVDEKNSKQTLICEVIAHDVKEVLITNYKLNSGAWSQPLFLMNDGSIKAYCSWEGDENAPRDDVSHLTPPQYEGGYK